MNKPISVEITETGFQTLKLLKSYMCAFLGSEALETLMIELVEHSAKMIKETPVRPVCPELALIGIQDYRQLNLLNNYKVMHRYDTATGKVFVVAYLRQKQSAQKALVDLSLMQ